MSEGSLEEQLLNKKAKLKTLQQKMQLNNKKIKLLRKENEQLKNNANKRSQSDTALLLQSKELSDANSKLQQTLQELQNKLQQPQTCPVPEFVLIKDTTITDTTIEVDLPAQEISDEDIKSINGFSQIQEFILGENNIQNQGISILCSSFPNLKKLIVNKNNFKADGMQKIGKLTNIKYLDVRDNNLGDECLQYISQCPSITDLSLSKNNISDVGAGLIQKLPNLTYLDITNNGLTDQGIRPLLKLQNLTHLYLMSNRLTQASVRIIIKKMKNLNTLDIRFNKFSEEERQTLRKEKPQNLQLFC